MNELYFVKSLVLLVLFM